MAKKPTANQTAYMELVAEIKRQFKRIGKRGYVPLDNVYKDETPKYINQKLLDKLKKAVENIYQFAKYYDPIKDSYIIGTERRRQEYSERSRKGWETRRANEAKRRAEELAKEQIEAEKAKQEKGQKDSGINEEEIRRKARKQAEDEQGLPREAEVAFEQIKSLIDNWAPSSLWSEELKRIKTNDRNQLKSTFEGAINSLGREQVVRNCLNHETELIDIVHRVLYLSGSTYKDYSAREGVQIDIRKFTEIIWGRPLTVAESKEVSDMMERLNEGE